ncbi:MAG: HAD-IA family hydrolase [Kofleriaceae bacterium]|nr:HAD-IA family hydrolase [Kofleriaceae bacterium]
MVYLGKPAPALFELARAGVGGDARLVMVGDQLETDIAGARAAGLDAAWSPACRAGRRARPPDRARTGSSTTCADSGAHPSRSRQRRRAARRAGRCHSSTAKFRS